MTPRSSPRCGRTLSISARSALGPGPGPGEVPGNTAAAPGALSPAGSHVSNARPFTGRVNLFAEVSGLCAVDRARVDRLNMVDETITLATIAPYTVVAPKQMVATVKVIPFAVRRLSVDGSVREPPTGAASLAVLP